MIKPHIEILRTMHLRGPNIWTYKPVLEAWIDIGELEDYPSNKIPGFNDRLMAWLPSMIEHRCSEGERGGFFSRLRDGTWPGHILEHVTLELQSLAGMSGGFGRARSTPVRGIYKVVVRAWHPKVTLEALLAARALVLAAMEDTPFDVAAAVKHLHELADDLLLGPSTASIVDAATAKERGIPAIRLSEGNLVQLGYGARSRRIWTAETDCTSAIAEGISRDKDLTKSLLQSCGVPVPEGRVVRSPAEAWEAAQDIGLPVVVKPSDANHGRGVSLELSEQAEIETAFHIADKEGSEVIVERFIPGEEHRLLIVGGKLVAATRGESLWVIGDGKSTVSELIDAQLNTDPRRGEAEEFPLEPIILSREPATCLLLERQGLQADSVPAAEQRVLIQRNGNMANDITDLVHPSVAATAGLAARVVGLDIAGIDLVVEDVSQPLGPQGGAIVEVNAGPGLLMHLKPASGQPRPVGPAIVDHLFPDGATGRIPVVGVSGSRGTTEVAKLVTWLLHLNNLHTGLACGDGLYFDRRLVHACMGNCFDAAERVLMNRMVEAAVIEHSPQRILSEGVAYDRCQVGILTCIDADAALDEFYIDTPEKVFSVFRTQIDLVLPGGAAVLNAEDTMASELAALSDGEVIFFSQQPASEVVQAHLAAGGRAVLLEGSNILFASGQETTVLMPKPDTLSPEEVLPAVAAAWAMAIPAHLIRTGVETFHAA